MPEAHIALSFYKAPWFYRQEARSGDVATYRRWKLYDGAEGAVHYEVVLIRMRREAVLPNGAVLPAAEAYPPSSSWGTRGWTFTTLADAQARFRSLVEAFYAHHT
jgi:hypothetical protein